MSALTQTDTQLKIITINIFKNLSGWAQWHTSIFQIVQEARYKDYQVHEFETSLSNIARLPYQEQASNILQTSTQRQVQGHQSEILAAFQSVPSVSGKHCLKHKWNLQTFLLNESLCYKASLATQISLGAFSEDNL